MKYRKGEFILVPNRENLRGMKPTTQALWMWLCNYADGYGFCYPSRERLRQDIGANSVRTVDAHLAVLLREGLLTKNNRFQGNKQVSNGYELNLIDGGAKNAPLHEEGCKKRHLGVQKTAHRTKPRTKPDIKQLNKRYRPEFLYKN